MALEPENGICVICLLFLLDRRNDKDMKPELFFSVDTAVMRMGYGLKLGR